MLCACTNGNMAALCAVMDSDRHPDLNKPLHCSNNQELTPLSISALVGSWDCCNLLLQRGADIATVDWLGVFCVYVCVCSVCVVCVDVCVPCVSVCCMCRCVCALCCMCVMCVYVCNVCGPWLLELVAVMTYPFS